MAAVELVTTRGQAPSDYDCPFCRMQRGEFDDRNAAGDVVAVTEVAFARIAPKWWPANDGAALVIPRAHHENIYELPPSVGHAVWGLVQQVAVVMRSAYACDGVSIRQHNEAAGGQDVWHLHVHVFPRHHDDGLYERHREARWVESAERSEFADRLVAQISAPRAFV